ncbi:MAG: PQQ-binding-like beta-propeller repeat protein, partial [Phycisphaerales bacterium]|nr:PQQ-binding-like beta-propeller repeat protein [Phycisphaerales bacterium]
AGSGRTIWTTNSIGEVEDGGEYLKPFASSPTISADGSRLVIGQGLHEDANCPLLCFELQTGRVVWALKTPLHVESSPAIFVREGKECAVVGVGAIEGPDRKAIGNPGYVLCADLATGKELWQYPLNDPESSPAVDEDGVIYIGSGINGNAVVAITTEEARSQKPEAPQARMKWKTPTPYPAVGDVALASHPSLGKLLLVGIGNGDYVFSDPKPAGLVMAIDCKTGKILWQTPMTDSVLGRLVVTSDNTTVLAGCRDGHAFALKLASGKILWQSRISETPNVPVLAGLVADETRAFSLAADGTLAVLSLSDGQLLDRVKLADASKSPQNLSMATPVLWGDVLFVATETTGLHAFRVRR